MLPVTFSPGLTGSTSFGANRTYADTTVSNAWALVATTSLIDVEASIDSVQKTSIRFVSATGLPRIVYAYVSLGGTDQVGIENGEVVQSSGPGIAILPGTRVPAGGSLQIERGQNAAITLEVVSTDPAGAQLVETWILRLRG